MRLSLTLIIAIIYNSVTFGQSVECSGTFSTNNVDDFKNSFGYDLGYNLKMIKKSKLSFHFSHTIKNAIYDQIIIDEESNGPLFPEYYSSKINALNQKFSVIFSYGNQLINKESSSLFIGSNLSYNCLLFDKDVSEIHYRPLPDNFFNVSYYNSKYNKKNRIGLDLFIEFEIKSIVLNKLNMFTRLNIGLLSYGTIGRRDGGYTDNWLTNWLTINFGLRYNLKSK